MNKVLLLITLALALTWSATLLTPPAAAQDTFDSALLNYAQIKHKSPGALDPLSVRSRYQKRKGRAARTRGANRRYRPLRVSNRRSRATYRATRRTTYRSCQ
jgi:hypothetical protein